MRRLAWLAPLLLLACSQPPDYVYRRCGVFDDCLSIVAQHPNQALMERASATLSQDLVQLDRITAPSSPGMGRTQALLRSQEWFSANPSLLPLLALAKAGYQASAGHYNPAAIGYWRRRSRLSADDPGRHGAPATMDDIEIQGLRLRGRHPDIDLDFGPLRAAHGIDMAHDYLHSLGVDRGLIRLGNTARALGNRPDAGRWPVELSVPKQGRWRLSLAPGTAVSACWQQTDAATILDPRSGQAPQAAQAVIVLHRGAVAASTACSALFVASSEQRVALAAKLEVGAARLWDAHGQTQDIGHAPDTWLQPAPEPQASDGPG